MRQRLSQPLRRGAADPQTCTWKITPRTRRERVQRPGTGYTGSARGSAVTSLRAAGRIPPPELEREVAALFLGSESPQPGDGAERPPSPPPWPS